MQTLFTEIEEAAALENAPLAVRMRPRTLDELVGRICETYSDGNGINHNEGCNLPRESEILHILHEYTNTDIYDITKDGPGSEVLTALK